MVRNATVTRGTRGEPTRPTRPTEWEETEALPGSRETEQAEGSGESQEAAEAELERAADPYAADGRPPSGPWPSAGRRHARILPALSRMSSHVTTASCMYILFSLPSNTSARAPRLSPSLAPGAGPGAGVEAVPWVGTGAGAAGDGAEEEPATPRPLERPSLPAGVMGVVDRGERSAVPHCGRQLSPACEAETGSAVMPLAMPSPSPRWLRWGSLLNCSAPAGSAQRSSPRDLPCSRKAPTEA